MTHGVDIGNRLSVHWHLVRILVDRLAIGNDQHHYATMPVN